MSCILNIIGKEFDVDNFVLVSKLVPYNISYIGSPRFKSKPDGKKHEFTGCSIEVSSAGFGEFNMQVSDAVEFLDDNREKLKLINATKEIEYAYLNFGVDHDDNKFVEGRFLPNELLKIAGELGISIEISTYNHFAKAE